jgi:hypothetical protein
VFEVDWKLSEGWGQLAKLLDYEGLSRSRNLSLLLDYGLLLHPQPTTRLENQPPMITVGRLLRRIQVESGLAWLRRLLTMTNLIEQLERLSQTIMEIFQLVPSKRHMSSRELGRLETTESLSITIDNFRSYAVQIDNLIISIL